MKNHKMFTQNQKMQLLFSGQLNWLSQSAGIQIQRVTLQSHEQNLFVQSIQVHGLLTPLPFKAKLFLLVPQALQL